METLKRMAGWFIKIVGRVVGRTKLSDVGKTVGHNESVYVLDADFVRSRDCKEAVANGWITVEGKTKNPPPEREEPVTRRSIVDTRELHRRDPKRFQNPGPPALPTAKGVEEIDESLVKGRETEQVTQVRDTELHDKMTQMQAVIDGIPDLLRGVVQQAVEAVQKTQGGSIDPEALAKVVKDAVAESQPAERVVERIVQEGVVSTGSRRVEDAPAVIIEELADVSSNFEDAVASTEADGDSITDKLAALKRAREGS